jgi:hypothetical protein
MRIIFTSLLIVLGLNLFAQDKIISGRIFDKNDVPLIGVTICQKNSDNCSYSDLNGVFHFLVDNKHENKIIFSYIGFHSVEMMNLDTINSPVIITMTEETISFDKKFIDPYPAYPRLPHKFGFISFIKVDYLPVDFGSFQEVLDDYNITAINRADLTMNVEMGGIYKRYYFGLDFGCAFYEDSKNDSLNVEFGVTQYGVNFGYNVINSKRFLVIPKLNFAWNRYHLINNAKERKIPIEQYVSDRDLDIRFNQLTGFAGLSISYKLYNHNILSSQYMTIGIYGGYLFKINDNPWIYSRRNRLVTKEKIKIEKYNIGFFYSFNID